MKKISSVLIVVMALATPVWAENYDFDGFSEVSVASGISVTVTAGEDYSVIGEAKRGNIKRLRIRKRGDELHIDRRVSWGVFNFFRNDRFVVYVTMPEIESVSASSGSSMTVDADGAHDFMGEASSGATLVIDDIGGGNVDLDASSGSTLRASGECTNINAQASSGSTLSAKGLECDHASVDASSGSSLRVFASKSVDGSASSGASVTISGNPDARSVDTSTGASVSN